MTYFICVRCIRRQAEAPEGVDGGITQEEARRIGWQFEPEVLCPFCHDYLRGPLPQMRDRE